MRLAGERGGALAVAALALLSVIAGGCEREPARPAIVVDQEPGVPIAPRELEDRAPRARSAPAPALPRKPFVRVSGPGYEGYVRPAHGPGHWEPTAEDIAALEQRVPGALARAAERGEAPAAAAADASGYARQYYGYIKDGNAMIEVRFFCESSRHLAAGDVHISGGGGCFFKTAYDSRTGRFLGFKSNAAR